VAALSYARLCALAGYQVPRITEVLPLLAGRAAAHLDLKDIGCADLLVRRAAEVLGPAGMIVTTGDVRVAATLRRRFPEVPVGLTVGGDMAETARFALRRTRAPRASRLDGVLAAGAQWAVLHHRLAAAGMAGQCRRLGVKTMVWTVNRDRQLASWLTSPEVDVLVTERPIRALALRGGCPQ
jgi:glycerophosphoryl diester phosphodiesterase